MSKKSVKLLSLFLSLCLVIVAFAGCGKKSASGSSKKLKVGFSVTTLQNPFFVDIENSMKASLKSGDSVIVNDANYNQAKQIADIEDMIQQKCSVIVLSPVDSKGVKQALEECKNAKIPVIVVNSPVYDTDLATCTIVSDNKGAGKQAAQALAKKLNGQGKIAEYIYSVTKVCKDRQDGFEEEIKKYPGIQIVNKQEGKPTTDNGLSIMENILQSNPDITGVFTINDPSGVGCIAAIESAHKLCQISVVCIDGSEQGKQMIKAGKMLGSVAQFPKQIGAKAIEVSYKLLNNEKVDKNVNIPVKFMDKASLGN